MPDRLEPLLDFRRRLGRASQPAHREPALSHYHTGSYVFFAMFPHSITEAGLAPK
jgi:hypothetical protein